MDSTEFHFKIFRLLLPVAGFALGLTVVYSLANWFLVAGPGYIPLDEQVVDDWLPLAIAIVFVSVWVAPAVNALQFSPKRNGPTFYFLIAVAAIAVPVIVAQNYVARASGTLTHVANAAQIGSGAATKYYAADSICLDHHNAVAQTAFETVGKQNETLTFNIYVAVPLCEENVRGTGQKVVWIGVTFYGTADNRLSPAEKEAKFRAFAERSQKNFDALDGSHYRYYERAPINAERRNLAKALAKAGISPDSAIFLIPHAEPFQQRTGNWLAWVFVSLGIAALVWPALVMFRQIDSDKVPAIKSPSSGQPAEQRGMGWSLFVPNRTAWGLPVLLDANIGVYLAMVFSGLGVVSFQSDDLIAWGANFGPLLHGIGLFRLISSQFVHGGLMHIAQNMYGLVFAGLLLMPVMRNWGLVLAYLVCGLAGGIASAVAHPGVSSVGASGAIMGLWGIVLVLALFNDARISEGRGLMLVNGVIFVGLTLFMGAVQPGIDNTAHLGGVAMGAVIGVVLLLTRGKNAENDHDQRIEPSGLETGMDLRRRE